MSASLPRSLGPMLDELAAMQMSQEQGQRLKAAWFALHEFDRPDAVIAAIRETLDSVRARP